MAFLVFFGSNKCQHSYSMRLFIYWRSLESDLKIWIFVCDMEQVLGYINAKNSKNSHNICFKQFMVLFYSRKTFGLSKSRILRCDPGRCFIYILTNWRADFVILNENAIFFFEFRPAEFQKIISVSVFRLPQMCKLTNNGKINQY